MSGRPEGGDIESLSLYKDISSNQIPIIYSPEYNISFGGLENIHTFDSKKWGKIYAALKEAGLITPENPSIEPSEARTHHLLKVHSQGYISSLKWSFNVARVVEVAIVACVPNVLVQRYLLRPFRFQTGGTILAAKLAIERGWAINLGGGFHHCSAHQGGGFCVYADITLCIRFAFDHLPSVRSAMIVDLDAHQGNGHERDFHGDRRVYIMDVYNKGIYPHDTEAKKAIDRKIELNHHTRDEEYLSTVSRNLEEALEDFIPDLVIYNAGTDILDTDPLGNLKISENGVIKRDEIVFTILRIKQIPLVMVTSGGYTRASGRVVAASILNLHSLGLLK